MNSKRTALLFLSFVALLLPACASNQSVAPTAQTTTITRGADRAEVIAETPDARSTQSALDNPSIAAQQTIAPATVRATAAPSSVAVTPTLRAAVTATTTLTRPASAAVTATLTVTNPGTFRFSVERIVTGFTRPAGVFTAGDGTGRLFVVEQPGTIRIVENGRLLEEPFLDITRLVNSGGTEQGLLSVAFHPDYESNGAFFVNYTRQPDGATVIARYQVSNDPNRADPRSAQIILTIPQPERNHNGGLSVFGPDGYLYIGTGDGGGAGDRHGTIGNGQDLGALLGKMLRIDVNQPPYVVPPDNPFVNQQGAKPEIWAYGLRNPWQFSFDSVTGDLYIADVGQNAYEEVHFQPASSRGGENYGWRIMEGTHCYSPSRGCDTSGLVLPVIEYSHDLGCSVTGGHVYRGSRYPWLNGLYIFADYCSGILFTSWRDANGEWQTVQRGNLDFTVSALGLDEAGELLVLGHDTGTLYRLTSSQ